MQGYKDSRMGKKEGQARGPAPTACFGFRALAFLTMKPMKNRKDNI